MSQSEQTTNTLCNIQIPLGENFPSQFQTWNNNISFDKKVKCFFTNYLDQYFGPWGKSYVNDVIELLISLDDGEFEMIVRFLDSYILGYNSKFFYGEGYIYLIQTLVAEKRNQQQLGYVNSLIKQLYPKSESLLALGIGVKSYFNFNPNNIVNKSYMLEYIPHILCQKIFNCLENKRSYGRFAVSDNNLYSNFNTAHDVPYRYQIVEMFITSLHNSFITYNRDVNQVINNIILLTDLMGNESFQMFYTLEQWKVLILMITSNATELLNSKIYNMFFRFISFETEPSSIKCIYNLIKIYYEDIKSNLFFSEYSLHPKLNNNQLNIIFSTLFNNQFSEEDRFSIIYDLNNRYINDVTGESLMKNKDNETVDKYVDEFNKTIRKYKLKCCF